MDNNFNKRELDKKESNDWLQEQNEHQSAREYLERLPNYKAYKRSNIQIIIFGLIFASFPLLVSVIIWKTSEDESILEPLLMVSIFIIAGLSIVVKGFKNMVKDTPNTLPTLYVDKFIETTKSSKGRTRYHYYAVVQNNGTHITTKVAGDIYKALEDGDIIWVYQSDNSSGLRGTIDNKQYSVTERDVLFKKYNTQYKDNLFVNKKEPTISQKDVDNIEKLTPEASLGWIAYSKDISASLKEQIERSKNYTVKKKDDMKNYLIGALISSTLMSVFLYILINDLKKNIFNIGVGFAILLIYLVVHATTLKLIRILRQKIVKAESGVVVDIQVIRDGSRIEYYALVIVNNAIMHLVIDKKLYYSLENQVEVWVYNTNDKSSTTQIVIKGD